MTVPLNVSNLAERLGRIRGRDVDVAIVGLGYVGLPLTSAFVRSGFRTLGVDVDPSKPARLLRGDSYLKHLDVRHLPAAAAAGRFDATTDFDRLREVDAILICVPTPVDSRREPDLRFVIQTAEAIAERLRPGQLVVLESTTYPGTTDELVRPILERSGLQLGAGFYLAYSPEREDPGNPQFTSNSIPKLVGGCDTVSGDLAEALYSAVVERVVRVSSARVAEAAKLTENVFRAVNIAWVNELKITLASMGLDVWEVLDAAATKPFGFMRFDPGPGWGGHCIPVDPFYLSWRARQFGVTPKFIELAGELNVRMHEYVIDVLVRALEAQDKAVRGSRLLLLGVAYKRGVDDCRESPAFPILDRLERLGADVVFHDSHVKRLPSLRDWPQFTGRSSVELEDSLVSEVDAVVIVTDHPELDYVRLANTAGLVVDTRGVCPRGPNVIRA